MATQVTAGGGSHELDIYAYGADGEVIKSVTFFSVGAGSSGCAIPAGPGVTICSPKTGETVTSPVHIVASGRNTNGTAGMDVWIDGQKVGFFPGQTVDTQANVPTSGSHQLDVYAVGTDGELREASVIFATQGSASCPAPSGSGALNLCYPINGSSVSSPVYVAVQGGGAVDTIEMWLDGTKFQQYSGSGGSLSIGGYYGIGSGSHRLTFVAKVNGTVTDQKSSTFTVQ